MSADLVITVVGGVLLVGFSAYAALYYAYRAAKKQGQTLDMAGAVLSIAFLCVVAFLLGQKFS